MAIEDDEPIDFSKQTPNQRKTMLANSEFAPLIVEIIRDCAEKVELRGKDQWETAKNAIIMETTSSLMLRVVEYLEAIKKGSLIGKQ